MPTPHNEPVDEEDDIANDEHWQCIDKHGAGGVACRLNFTTEETCEREDHQEYGDNEDG